MALADGARHGVAVVRVEVPDSWSPEMIIEIVEVGPRPGTDRLLGRATTPDGVCLLLQQWLMALIAEPERDQGSPPSGSGATDDDTL